MKLIKFRLIKLVAFCLLFNFASFMEVNSLYGNAHYNLAELVIDKGNINISESNKNAFLSGTVYADIGKFKFDKEVGVESDSLVFAQAMKKFAKTSDEKWFVRGIEMHVLQDNETVKFLKNIFKIENARSLDYIMRCGLLDCYFLNKNNKFICNDSINKFNFKQVTCNLDLKYLSKTLGVSEDKIEPKFKFILENFYGACEINKNHLITYDELIIKTYESFGYTVTKDEIQEQEANMLGAFIIVASLTNVKNFSMGYDITDEIEKFVDLCVADLRADIPLTD